MPKIWLIFGVVLMIFRATERYAKVMVNIDHGIWRY